MSASTPLQGVRVVDFTHVLAGPACAYFLGLLGARVVKVEGPRGDAIRHRGGTDGRAAARGLSTAYCTQAGGKETVSLDLDTAEGRATMERLLADADVLVENHRPATLRRLGLHEDETLTRHPRLVHCAMTGYGRGGPLEEAPAYDVNIQAACGLMEMTGSADGPPTRVGAPVIDYATALAAAFAIATALYERERTGRGTFIDVSMLETAHTLMASTITDTLATGNEPRRRGNAANSRSPAAGSFPCREGVLSLGVNEEGQFLALADALGRADWRTDERFATREARDRNAGALVTELEAALARHSAREWEGLLLAAGVPCARLRTLSESLAEEQVHARGYLQRAGPDGPIVPTLPFRMGHRPAPAPRCTPREIGADNRRHGLRPRPDDPENVNGPGA